MSKSSQNYHTEDDIDLAALGSALWRAKGWIFGLAILAGLVTFVGLSMMRPLYTSEARILVQNEDSAFTRPTTEEREPIRAALDEQAVQSQVQVITSRDLILQVVRDLDLVNNPAFAKDAGKTLIGRLIKRIGLGRSTPESEEEKAANALADHLDVFQLSKSSVIAIQYTSGDSELAAKIANKLADVYIGWQRTAKIEQTKDATAWLDDQIKALRKATSESEAAVENYKTSEGLYAGSNNVMLNAQQLSELNSQLILASAQESEARARAKLIKQMLADNGDIDATPEVLKSQLIINLVEQRVQVQRALAELSATLLPSHPRIQQLRSELADVRAQIRDEAQKVVKSLENEAQVAAAREASLRASLNAAKSKSAGLSDAEIKLRALEREAKANRDLLQSYLARYRDASARHDMGAVPAQAAIVSRAHASVLPSFPKRGPLSALVMAATALLALAYTLARELIGGVPAARGRYYVQETRERRQRRPEPLAPAYPPERPQRPAPKIRPAAAKQPPARSVTEAPAPQKPKPEQPKPERPKPDHPAAEKPAAAAPARNLPVIIPVKPAAAPAQPAQAKTEGQPPRAKTEAQPEPAPREASQPPSEPGTAETPTRPSVWRAEKAPKRPSWLRVNETRRRPKAPQQSTETPTEQSAAANAAVEQKASAPAEVAPSQPKTAAPPRSEPAPEPAAAGLLDRLRQGFAEESRQTRPAQTGETATRRGGFLDRFRRAGGQSAKAGKEARKPSGEGMARSKPEGTNMAALSPNDLRSYLTQRIAMSEDAPVIPPKPKIGTGHVGPVLRSLDAVLDKILSGTTGGLPRALLVAGTSSKADATQAAIRLAQALVDRNEQVVLVDIAKGASAVSGPLGMPRVPGFTDLAAGRASFGEVVRVDDDTPLQVITAGNPTVRGEEPEPDCFMRVFEALTQAYGCVVLHADLPAINVLMPALKFELPAMVAVLPPRGDVDGEKEALSTFQALGCPVVVYEGSGKPRRARLFQRSAAV